MPTGYTAGILDGTTKIFEDYAKLCMRAFGTTMHMRDDPLNKEFEPQEPSDYHIKAITEAKKELQKLTLLSDDQLIIQEKESIAEDLEYHQEAIRKDKINEGILSKFLAKAANYKPPTEDHEGICDFMQEQLKSTITHDCNRTYHIDTIKSMNEALNNLNADNIKSARIESCNHDIEYHTKEHAKEVERCNDGNKWVQDFLDSI